MRKILLLVLCLLCFTACKKEEKVEYEKVACGINEEGILININLFHEKNIVKELELEVIITEEFFNENEINIEDPSNRGAIITSLKKDYSESWSIDVEKFEDAYEDGDLHITTLLNVEEDQDALYEVTGNDFETKVRVETVKTSLKLGGFSCD